jgi:hypothetical protein
VKAQTRIGSLIESGQNIAIGYGISVVATCTIGPYFHMHPGVGDVMGFGLAMTAVSVIRQYVIRRYHEWRRGRNVPPDFLHIIEELAAERQRQINGEGYSLDHDDEHTYGELAAAGAGYAIAGCPGLEPVLARRGSRLRTRGQIIQNIWPWDWPDLKEASPRRNLVKAGAMIIAEIGRIDRAGKAVN